MEIKNVPLTDDELSVIEAALQFVLQSASKAFQEGAIDNPITMDKGFQEMIINASELYKRLKQL